MDAGGYPDDLTTSNHLQRHGIDKRNAVPVPDCGDELEWCWFAKHGGRRNPLGGTRCAHPERDGAERRCIVDVDAAHANVVGVSVGLSD